MRTNRKTSLPSYALKGFLILQLFVFSFSTKAQQTYDFSDSAVASRIKHDVYVLASDSLMGREAGTQGEIKAGKYILQNFKECGLLPLPGDTTMLWPFTFKDYYLGERGYLKIKGKTFIQWVDFNPLYATVPAELTSVCIDIGYANNKLLNKSALGKIALIDVAPVKIKKSISNEPDTINLPLISRIQNAIDNGAIAVFLYKEKDKNLINIPNKNYPVPLVFISNTAYNSIKLNITETVALKTKIYQTRKNAANIIGYIDNKSPYTIVIGAHYDHMGYDSLENKTYYGADDNASGTAGVMELARFLKAKGRKDINFMLCAFSAEEKGLYGSQAFVNSIDFTASSTICMLDLDMIGRMGAFGNMLFVNSTKTSKSWKTILKKSKPVDFNVKKLPAGLDGSDHRPFYQKGIPVLFFITGLHDDYHTPRDIASKINYSGETSIVKYIEKIISVIDSESKMKFRKPNIFHKIRSNLIYLNMIMNKQK